MDSYFERVKSYLNNADVFAKENNMRITRIEEGHSEGEFTADERHWNGLHIVQGGAIFTFADFIFAGTVNSYGVKAIGMNANISYLRPGTGRSFRAVADAVSKGRRTCLVSVQVFDEKNRLIAHATMNGFFLEEPFFDSSAPAEK